MRRLILPLLALTFVVPGCGRRSEEKRAKQLFGDVVPFEQAALADGDLAPLLKLVRSVVAHDDPAKIGVPTAPGRRVFVSAYCGGTPSVETAIGATLQASVEGAASKLQVADPSGCRFELDVVTRAEAVRFDETFTTPAASIGLDGYLIGTTPDDVGFVAPTEVVREGLFGGEPLKLQRDRLIARMTGRVHGKPAGMSDYVFRSQSVVESMGPDRAALVISRGLPRRDLPVTPAGLLDAARAAADYLASVTGPKGRYAYVYHPVDERPDSSYGWLRHAGTTYALLEAYEEFRTPLYLEKATLAVDALKGRLQEVLLKEQGGMTYLQDNAAEEQQKVGGAGLALLALTKHASLTGKQDNLWQMRALGRLIVHQQQEDGHFHNNADIARETPSAGPARKPELFYYAGEAALGLLRLYAIDPKPSWKDAAKKAVDYCMTVRDAGKTDDTLDHDHWLAYALNDLDRVERSPAYAAHAERIFRAIAKRQATAASKDAPTDMVGSFYDGSTTPTATRLEAYDAMIALARFNGKSDAELVRGAESMARFLRAAQYDDETSLYVKSPERARGGLRESLFVSDIRIDYVQHALSGLLHLARSLRDPAYGAR